MADRELISIAENTNVEETQTEQTQNNGWLRYTIASIIVSFILMLILGMFAISSIQNHHMFSGIFLSIFSVSSGLSGITMAMRLMG